MHCLDCAVCECRQILIECAAQSRSGTRDVFRTTCGKADAVHLKEDKTKNGKREENVFRAQTFP